MNVIRRGLLFALPGLFFLNAKAQNPFQPNWESLKKYEIPELLNVGPKAGGTIPDKQKNLLLAMGKWLGINGEAIYGTRPWKVFGKGPVVTEIADQANTKADQAVTKVTPFTSADIRFTTKGNIVYAMPLVIPSGNISISSLSSKNTDQKIASVELVGSNKKINWKQQKDGLIIQAPKKYPSEYAAAFKIVFKNQ